MNLRKDGAPIHWATVTGNSEAVSRREKSRCAKFGFAHGSYGSVEFEPTTTGHECIRFDP
jgi:hypothetical protein